MHNAPHPRHACRLEQRKRVAHRLAVLEGRVIETHPIRVVERVHIGKRRRESLRISETQRPRRHQIPKRLRPTRRVGEGDHLAMLRQQMRGDVFAGIAVGPGDSVLRFEGGGI